MAISNFTYDGISLTSFDKGEYVLAFFDADATPEEGQGEMQKISQHMGMYQPFAYQTHPQTLTFTMGITKNPCLTDKYEISAVEMERLKQWLCRPTACKLKINEKRNLRQDWGETINQYEGVFWEGTFTLVEENLNGKRIGATLTFISTRPYGLGEDITYSGTVEANGTVVIEDTSSEIGYIYPRMQVKTLTSGNLSITNSMDSRSTVVNNCSANEVITFSDQLQIATDKSSHTIYNDFNYQFLRISNTFNNKINTLTFSLKSDYEIIYNPIRKVIPI